MIWVCCGYLAGMVTLLSIPHLTSFGSIYGVTGEIEIVALGQDSLHLWHEKPQPQWTYQKEGSPS